MSSTQGRSRSFALDASFSLFSERWATAVFLTGTAILLVACGGGGGGGSTAVTPTVTSWASSGNYGPVLRIAGGASAAPLSIALSLAHPANPAVEYVIDESVAPTFLGFELKKGNFNSATQQFTDLTSFAYIDAPRGAIRSTSMVATGARPVQAQASVTSLCSQYTAALNFSTPYSSQIAASAPGPDGICDSADDTYLLVTFSATGTPAFASFPVGKPLGYLRSPSTGVPTQWLVSTAPAQLTLVPFAAGTPVNVLITSMMPAPPATVYKPVLNLNEMIVFTKDGALQSLNAAGTSATVNQLSALTGPDGWKPAGSDANNAYVYLNSSTASSGAGNWRMLAISRATQSTSTLATGAGSIAAADAAPDRIFVTLQNGSSSSVVRISTPGGTISNVVAASSSTTSFVQVGANGVHLLLTTGNPGSVATSVIDNTGVMLYSAASGLFYGGDQDQYDAVTGEYRPSSFLVATPFGSLAFSGSSLVRFDIAGRTTRTLGAFPTGAALGGIASDGVFVSPLLPANGAGGASVARVVSSQLLTSGAAVYTYNTGVANSLTKTTVQVR